LTYKPSKVLIIGSGPIIIGHFYCHSEGAQRPKNLGEGRYKPHPEILRCAQDDNNMKESHLDHKTI
jgi:hypothetical protein